MKRSDDYRLSSLEEPTDEQLAAIMEGVAEEARRSTARYNAELDRRMRAVADAARAAREKETAAS